MAVVEGNPQSERKKLIVAIVLGAIAVIALAYMFLGSSSKSTITAKGPKPSPTPVAGRAAVRNVEQGKEPFTPTIIDVEMTLPAVPEAGRNIFAFYTPTPKPTVDPASIVPVTPPPPTPVPPNLILASISPVNVYAHTGDFTLDVVGDKFTPETRIFMAGAELQTRFVSPQQLSTKVPAQLISFEGGREVSVRSRDGQLFSNTATLNVMPAPVPNYTFVGASIKHGGNDIAIVKEKNGRDLLNVQRGDIIGGRFRVTSISVRELTLTDTTLNIKHKIPMTGEGSTPGGGQPRYQTPPPQPPPSDTTDDDTEP